MPDQKIAYIISSFPVLTETFITREIEELRKRGITVEVFSLKAPNKNDIVYSNSEVLIETTHYFPFFFSLKLWNDFFFWVKRKPKQCIKIITILLRMYINHPVLLIKSLAVIPKAFAISVIVKKLNINKIHAHWASIPTTVAWVVSTLNEIDFTFTAHAWDIFKSDKMLQEKITDARKVITCTNFNKDYLLRRFPSVDPNKIVVVYHGLDLIHFSLKKNIKSSKFTILCIGRLVEKKGFHILLRACSLLRGRAIPFLCQIIYVHGDYEKNIFHLYETLQLQDCVELVPEMPQEKLIYFYKNADCFVLPCVITESGDRDGIPNVILESLAMELPVVSTSVSGIPEVIKHGETGLLVKPENAEELAHAIERLYSDSKLRKKLGTAGRNLMIKHFDISSTIDQLSEYIL